MLGERMVALHSIAIICANPDIYVAPFSTRIQPDSAMDAVNANQTPL